MAIMARDIVKKMQQRTVALRPKTTVEESATTNNECAPAQRRPVVIVRFEGSRGGNRSKRF